jgi:hypothetical protein
MIFHATMNGNALGRLDQFAWPYLRPTWPPVGWTWSGPPSSPTASA